MGIKWEDVRILNSPISNKIYLGKGKRDTRNPGLIISTDKSQDRTDEILAVVMVYMDTWSSENKSKGMEIKNVMGSLTWRKAGDN